jgi:hypothetical protein
MKTNSKILGRFVALFCLIITLTSATQIFAQEPIRVELTSRTYSEKADLDRMVKKELGDKYSLADWNDLKSIRNIYEWIKDAHIKNGWTFMVTKDGQSTTKGNRQYFVYYSANGTTPPGFEHNGVYDKIGNKLYLGAWYNLNAHILVVKNQYHDRDNHRGGNDCENFIVTSETYSEKDNLGKEVKRELGHDFSIADWNDLKSIRNIHAWIECMGLKRDQSFMITKDGAFKYSGKRQYFVLFSPGGAPSAFLVHDKIDNKLFLGSWFGENRNILAKKNR